MSDSPSSSVNVSYEEPLLGLCTKPMHEMTVEELRAKVSEIQELRSPQTWRSRAVKSAEKKEEKQPQINIDDLL